MKPQHPSIKRIWKALLYSKDGLIATFTGEAAFRQELLLFLAALPVLYFLPISLLHKLTLLSVNSFVLIVEILNSSIEAVIDLVSPEYNALAKKAKDMGSAAVFLSLALAATLWLATAAALLFHPVQL